MSTTTPPIVVPAPTFRDDAGNLDVTAIGRYAAQVAETWVPYVILSGPMGRGEHATVAERITILDVWLSHISPARLVAACWNSADTAAAQEQGARPLMMLQADSEGELTRDLSAAPAHSWVYANPRYSNVLLTPDLVSASAVAGVKLSKVSATDLREMRAANPDTVIVHGSSRAVASSMEAGADLVTTAPLAALPSPWPDPSIAAIQQSADTIQAVLDDIPSHDARVDAITRYARQTKRSGAP